MLSFKFKDDFWPLGQFWERVTWHFVEANADLDKTHCFFPLPISEFAICGLGHQGNLRVCDVRINHYKFADLRFADWQTSSIMGYLICPVHLLVTGSHIETKKEAKEERRVFRRCIAIRQIVSKSDYYLWVSTTLIINSLDHKNF